MMICHAPGVPKMNSDHNCTKMLVPACVAKKQRSSKPNFSIKMISESIGDTRTIDFLLGGWKNSNFMKEKLSFLMPARVAKKQRSSKPNISTKMIWESIWNIQTIDFSLCG